MPKPTAVKPKPPKHPKPLLFTGESGNFDMLVYTPDSPDINAPEEGIRLDFDGCIHVIPGKRGRLAAKELYKFAEKLLRYATLGKQPKVKE